MLRIFKVKGANGRPVYFETDGVVRESKIGALITGKQLDHEGGRIQHSIVMLTPADLAAAVEMEMDLHYARLVPIGTAKLPLRMAK